MTIAISIATSAKYHEAINMIEIDRITPIRERLLKEVEKNVVEKECLRFVFTNDKIEIVVANSVLLIWFVMHKLN
jgi:hypothetical protein